MGQSEDRHRETSGNGNGENGTNGSGRRQPLSDWIRAARRERRLTQQEVASKVGITVRSISGWESGKTVPHMETLAALARVLGQEPQPLTATAQEMTGRRLAAKVERVAPRIEGALNEVVLNLRTEGRA